MKHLGGSEASDDREAFLVINAMFERFPMEICCKSSDCIFWGLAKPWFIFMKGTLLIFTIRLITALRRKTEKQIRCYNIVVHIRNRCVSAPSDWQVFRQGFHPCKFWVKKSRRKRGTEWRLWGQPRYFAGAWWWASKRFYHVPMFPAKL